MTPQDTGQKVLQEIGAYAHEIYRRLQPGVTITLTIPESKILLPSDPTPRDGGFLVIHKPSMMIGLNVTPMAAMPNANPETPTKG